MATNSFKVKNSLNIQPSAAAGSEAGDIRIDSSDSNKLKYHNGSTEITLPLLDTPSNDRAVVTDSVGNMTTIDTTATELGYVNGVTSSIQDQLDDKVDSADLTAHLSDTSDAHDASAISVTPAGNLAADDVQEALEELQTSIDGIPTDFANDTSLDLATSNSATTVNIGTGTDTNTINIGGANTTINMTGSVNNQNVTNLDVDDKLITINKGGAAGSGAVAGIDVEEGGSATGYVKTSADRNSFEVKAPNTAGVVSITPGASNDEVALLAKAQTLSNKTLTSPVINTPTVDVMTLDGQGSTPANPLAGDLKVYAKTDGKVYKLDSNGVEKAIGSGGAGGKNYAEDYYDGTSVTGITGTTGLTASVNSSSPLRADGNIRLSKDASDRQNGYWTVPLTDIDEVDRKGARPLVIKFRVRTSAAYASSDIRIRIYDNDAADYVNVSSLQDSSGYLLASPDGTLYTGHFYCDPDNADLEIRVFVATTNASAYDIDVVDVSVGADQVVPGAIITEWQSYTPTGSWVANTTYIGRYRRVGDTFEGEVRVVCTGAPTAADLTVSILSGLTIDTAKLPDTEFGVALGSAIVWDRGTNNYTGVVYYNDSTTVKIVSNAGGVWSSSAPFTFGNTDEIGLYFRVPIANWSASVALSTAETMLRAVKVRATSTAATSFADNTEVDVPFATEQEDSHNAFDGTTFTAPKTADYLITAQIGVEGLTINTAHTWYFNITNASNTQLGLLDSHAITATNIYPTGSKLLRLNQGDQLKIRFYQVNGATRSRSTSATQNMLQIIEWSDLSVFSVYGVSEYQESKAASTVAWPVAATVWTDLTSLTLSPGEHDLSAIAMHNNGGAVNTGNLNIGISTTSGNSAAGLSFAENRTSLWNVGTNGANGTAQIPNYRVVVTSPTTYYLKAMYDGTTTNLNYLGYRLSARRVK